MGADQDHLFAQVAERRRALADLLRTFDDRQWAAPTLCSGWDVKELVGHLVTPMLMSLPRIGWEIVRCGGSTDRAFDRLAHKYGRLPTEDMVDVLEDGAELRYHPPTFGAEAPLSDITIHTIDVRWSLERREPVPEPAAVPVLDFLLTKKAAGVFTPKGLVDGVRWVADDLDWSGGADDGPVVEGPSDAVLCVLGGRRAGLDGVRGDAVRIVAERLSR